MKYDIKDFTLQEKMALLAGRNVWQLSNANGKLPDIFLADGPHGLRMNDLNSQTRTIKKATAMPCLAMLANSWNVELAYLDGETIADDCIEKGADVLLAPGVNMKRTPLCGRNFEYFSEDPLLTGYLAKAFIEGVQSKGIGTSLKHFALNNREFDRQFQSSEVDERTLREIYLPAFEIAVEAKPWTVMCAYNPVNGVYASENKWLLKDILRDEFGFDGVIVSDWGAVKRSWRSAKASLDLAMPYEERFYHQMEEAYAQNLITEEEIDERVNKILELIEKTQNKKDVTTTQEQRHNRAVQIAKECIVLLKNEDNILPLKQGKIAFAGCYESKPVYGGGGSAFVESEYVSKPLHQEVQARLGDSAECYKIPQFISDGMLATVKFSGIATAAYRSDICVLCVGNNERTESENFDRDTLRLTKMQENVILAAAEQNPNVVVVLTAGSAVDMSAWIDKVKAVVFAGFCGEGAQEALADILVGNACPCAKLSETFPLSVEDTPTGTETGDGFAERYEEGVFVGYRWYDKKKKDVLFPFGYGLSYAEFAYSDLEVRQTGDLEYDVTFTVKNTSKIDAKEIVQLYVRDVFAMVSRPIKELKGFKKIALKAGESKHVSLKLNSRSFAYYSTPLKAWRVEKGEFEIMVGASSRDIRLMQQIKIDRPDCEMVTTL